MNYSREMVGMIVGLLIGTTCFAQSVSILAPEKDAIVSYHYGYGSAEQNYNNAVHYSAIAQPGAAGGVNKARGLIEFDLSVIPAGDDIFGAFLSLSASGPVSPGEVSNVGSIGQNESRLVRITSPWNDASVTWNTQPTTTDVHSVTLSSSTHPMENYLNIDVTELVRDMIADPAPSHGFMIKLVDETPSRGLLFFGGLAPEADKVPQLLVLHGDCKWTIIQEQLSKPGGLSIAPNPTLQDAPILINWNGPAWNIRDLRLVDVNGRTIWEQVVRAWPVTAGPLHLAGGSYVWMGLDAHGNTIASVRMVME